MDQEQLLEFQENLARLNETLASTGQTGSAMNSELQKQINAFNQMATAANKNSNEVNDQTKSFENLNKRTEAYNKQIAESKRRQELYDKAIDKAADSMGSMVIAVLDTERTFKKYSGAVSSMGDSAMSVGNALGGVYKAAGLVIKGMSFVAEKAFEQADNLVTATDTLRKMGGAGAYTSEEFLGLAHSAGVTSKNLDILVKPIQNLGTSVMGLGLSAGDGIKAFTQLTAVTDQQRMEFRRLGINQEELVESQSAYIQLQNASGRQMRRAGETEEQRIRRLQKESLAYTKNLSELAALTGKDVSTLQKEQQAALAREEFMIKNAQTEAEINRLREAGREDEARSLEQQLEARNKFVTDVSTTVGSAELDTALMQMITSGGAVFTEETAALARSLGLAGEDFNKFQKMIEAGDMNAAGEFLEALKKGTNKATEQLGQAGILGGQEVRGAFLMTSEIMQFTARRAGEDEEDARARARRRIEEAAGAGFDPTMDARAMLTELEIDAGVAMDRLLSKVNPLVGGFTALNVAALAAAAALTAMSAKTMLGGIGGAGGAAGKAAGSALSMARGLVNPANVTKGMRLGAGVGAGVLAAGMGIHESVSAGAERRRDIEGRRAAGLISDEEAESAQGVSSTRTAGQSAGVAAGALAGGLKGAAMGAALGPIGAAVGGMIGAGLGAYIGKKGGAMIGEAIGEQFGDAVAKRDFSKEMEETSAELDALRAVGASDEEIAYMEEKLHIQEALKQAEEEGNFEAMRRLLLVEELHAAKQGGSEEEIQQLEKQIELENKLANQTSELTALEDSLKRAQEMGVSEDLLAKLRAKVEEKQKEVDATKEQTDAIREQRQAEKEAEEQAQRKIELTEKIKKLEAEKASLGGSFGSFFNPEARAKRRELEAAQKEMAGIMSEEPPQAQSGGVFSGPQTGFPVELHGTELVAPLDPNSVLMELAKTPASTSAGETTTTTSTEKTERTTEINLEMMQLLSSKLDSMIDILENGNEISDQILKQAY